MAKWLERLEDVGRKAVQDSKPARSKPEIQRVVVTTRYSDRDSGDPGAARSGFYYVEYGVLHMVDEAGNPLKNKEGREITVALEVESDARAVAASLLSNIFATGACRPRTSINCHTEDPSPCAISRNTPRQPHPCLPRALSSGWSQALLDKEFDAALRWACSTVLGSKPMWANRLAMARQSRRRR
jgi:hypothetical protein